eukprot:1160181-Pelagomonas_calceolata.AAC.1
MHPYFKWCRQEGRNAGGLIAVVPSCFMSYKYIVLERPMLPRWTLSYMLQDSSMLQCREFQEKEREYGGKESFSLEVSREGEIEREGYASQVQLRAFRKSSPTRKLARASLVAARFIHILESSVFLGSQNQPTNGLEEKRTGLQVLQPPNLPRKFAAWGAMGKNRAQEQ